MSVSGLQHFTYHHVPSTARQTLFLLHGTGGDQFDLLPIVRDLQPHFQVVSLLGNVREHGMPRFFVRQPSGEFDVQSIEIEAEKLRQFVEAWCASQALSLSEVAFLGYSNGANMIMALAQLFPEVVQRAVILHGLLPLDRELSDFSGKNFLVTYGENDQMIPPQKAESLVDTLRAAGAQVETVIHSGGHEFRAEEQTALLEFLQPKQK